MSRSNSFLSPLRLGDLALPNRVVMAPLTRLRNTPDGVPTALAREYYAQRAGAGLIVAEATAIAPQGRGYPGAPGIYTDDQVAGWRTVTDAVHRAGGRIASQLWHVGRISHSSFQPDGGPPLAPSAIAPEGQGLTADGRQVPFEVPRALELAELPGIVSSYARAAGRALEAGFDAVEVHGANGYLLDQFLEDRSNRRTDEYGGSFENRARLLFEVVDAVAAVVGPGRVGVRLSPNGSFNTMGDSDPVGLFGTVIRGLDRRHLAYLHLIEPRQDSAAPAPGAPGLSSARFRPLFRGPLIAAGGYDREDARRALAEGRADAVAFGRWFISNPDLVQRLALDLPLTPYDRSTFYGGDARGYTDYPVHDAAQLTPA
jgi:N-ethylmaleimide reductase